MIRLNDITLTFPDGDSRVTAVDGVSLTAHPGTVTGITGPVSYTHLTLPTSDLV